jgi:hypothetical protein
MLEIEFHCNNCNMRLNLLFTYLSEDIYTAVSVIYGIAENEATVTE